MDKCDKRFVFCIVVYYGVVLIQLCHSLPETRVDLLYCHAQVGMDFCWTIVFAEGVFQTNSISLLSISGLGPGKTAVPSLIRCTGELLCGRRGSNFGISRPLNECQFAMTFRKPQVSPDLLAPSWNTLGAKSCSNQVPTCI